MAVSDIYMQNFDFASNRIPFLSLPESLLLYCFKNVCVFIEFVLPCLTDWFSHPRCNLIKSGQEIVHFYRPELHSPFLF